ncbi:HD domain-containing protein, partial [bacterium]|nr:HD domain-containing protein [bacterium]
MITSRVREAIDWAAELHGDQRRKGSGIPYLYHLLAVAALVADHGGSDTEIVGAVLHDVIEDCAHEHRGLREELVRRFGDDVAAIVDACSDAEGEPKPPWRKRKTEFVASLEGASPSVRLVVAADKLHNATCTVRDLRAEGDVVWKRFRGGRNGTV